jgi:hypothetical protein
MTLIFAVKVETNRTAERETNMENGLSLTFERGLYQAVARFKREHPGMLEARTKRREESDAEKKQSRGGPDRPEVREGCRNGESWRQ